MAFGFARGEGTGEFQKGERGYPHPPVFLAKSAESLEKKRVELLQCAKECARV
jgi:hypothetical protein